MDKSLVALGVTEIRQEVTFLQLGAAYHGGVGIPQHIGVGSKTAKSD